MTELLSTRVPGQIAYYRAILEHAEIQTFVRNEHVSGAEGMIPIFEPALCVVNDEDVSRVLDLMREAKMTEDPGDGPKLRCPACGEDSPSNFAACWSCGAELVG